MDTGLGLLLVLAAWFVWASALTPDLPAAPPGVTVGAQEIWEDVTAAATWTDVVDGAATFEPVGDRIPNYGYRASAFWMRLTVTDHAEAKRLYAAVSGALLDDVRLFARSPDGRLQVARTGASVPAVERPVPQAARLMLLPFEIDRGESVELYLRLHTPSGVSSFPLTIIDEPAMREDAAADARSHGILLGIFTFIFAYNLLLWVFLRDRVYAVYCGYLACTFSVSSLLNGNGATFFYPHHTWPTQHLVVPVGGLSVWLLLTFTRLFLHTADHLRLDRLLRAGSGAVLLLAGCSPILPQAWVLSVMSTIVAVIPVVCVAVGVVAWRAGKRQARFYLAGSAWGALALIVMTGLTIGAVPIVRATVMAFSYGTAADGALLAFALADRIRVLQRQRRSAERRARAALSSRAQELERLVAERTAEIERMAVTDSLTGVANRYGLDRAAAEVDGPGAPSARPYAVLMIDIDRFKSVNDRFGHDVGDRVLREVAARIADLVRPGDVVGRLGGEEFVVLFVDADAEQGLALAERIRSAVAATVTVGPPPRPVTVSIGVAARSPGGAEVMDDVRRRADAALYRAKQSGRDRVVLSPDPPDPDRRDHDRRDHDRRDHDRRDHDRRDHDQARQAPT